MFTRTIAVVAGVFAAGAHAQPTEYNGIVFPQGDISFADQVIAYEPDFDGGNVPTNPDFTDPAMAVGPPDYSGGNNGTGSVSLGDGGRITLRFTDNALSASGDETPDLHIFEIGSSVEDMFVEISIDGVTFYDAGSVSGATSSVDIDPFVAAAGLSPFTKFLYVRLTDDGDRDGQSGSTVGADVDAVGAINTTPACQADFNSDGILNNTDINIYVAAFLAGNPAADFNADGLFNNQDVNLYVNAFLAGCILP